MNNTQIIETLEVISPYSHEELLSYSSLITSERETVEKRLEEIGEESSDRAVMLAAARINYKIALIRQSTDKVTQFKAGDISITEGSEALENAKRLLDEVSSDCPSLADCSEGFAFRTV